MKRLNDQGAWADACLQTPAPMRAATAELAAKVPGNHVKSIERETEGSLQGWPKYHGVLVRYDEWMGQGTGYVLVRSVGSPVSEPGTVWIGTVAEYHAMWVVD